MKCILEAYRQQDYRTEIKLCDIVYIGQAMDGDRAAGLCPLLNLM